MNEYSNLLPLKQILIFALFVVALLTGTGIQFPNYAVVLILFGPRQTKVVYNCFLCDLRL